MGSLYYEKEKGMSTKNAILIIIGLLIITIGISIVAEARMPAKMVSHWNAQGQPDGYSSKSFALYFLPAMELGLVFLLFGLPLIDPRKENIRKFQPAYNWFVVLVIGFMSYLHLLTLGWNIGLKFDFLRWMVPAFAVLIYFTGSLIGGAQPNWFIGIRTPWTLSDNRVWERTHRIGGVAFKCCGVISVAGLIHPPITFWLLIIPLMITAFGLVVYSYIYYRKIHQVEI